MIVYHQWKFEHKIVVNTDLREIYALFIAGGYNTTKKKLVGHVKSCKSLSYVTKFNKKA